MDSNFVAKLGDFGFSKELPKVTPGKTLVTMLSVAKTPGYSAPELDTRHQSHKTDVYSYGVVSFKILPEPGILSSYTCVRKLLHIDKLAC